MMSKTLIISIDASKIKADGRNLHIRDYSFPNEVDDRLMSTGYNVDFNRFFAYFLEY